MAIDDGALAFISSEAGAVVTDFQGNFIDSFRSVESRVLSEVVIAVSPEVHAQVLFALR